MIEVELIINEYNNKYYYIKGTRLLHREDGPAVEYPDGEKHWCQHGKPHREDGPAIEYTSGSKLWYQHSKLHRLDGPAVEHYNGNKSWYLDGKIINCTSQQQFEKLLKLKVFW